MGFAAFPGASARHTLECFGRSARSPRRGSYPSKVSPHQQPYRITAAVALLPLVANLLARNLGPTEAGTGSHRRTEVR
jgi:hypothetical protein